jgi:tetratricopeptide (TPR) repeat protein
MRPSNLRALLRIVRFLLLMLLCFLLSPLPAQCQDSGDEGTTFRGNHAEIAVTVRDSSGEPISVSAMVKLYRTGGIPSGQGATSKGRAFFILQSLGDYTLVVDAAGYKTAQREVSVPVAVRAEVDVYMSRQSASEDSSEVPRKPLLAPKAKQAFDKGLQALSEDKLDDAEKYVDEAMKLAPGHPDVLYAQGVLDLRRRNWVQAQGVLEKATRMDPSHARAFAALGMSLSNQGKYDAAIAPLETSLQLDAGSWETRWTLASAYYHHEQYEAALKMAQEAQTQSNGKAPEIDLLVAQSLTAVGRYEDSAQVLREFLKNHGDRPQAATARRWLRRLSADGKIRPD